MSGEGHVPGRVLHRQKAPLQGCFEQGVQAEIGQQGGVALNHGQEPLHIRQVELGTIPIVRGPEPGDDLDVLGLGLIQKDQPILFLACIHRIT